MFIHLLTNSMDKESFLKTWRFSASRKIPRILWNPKVHYRVYNSPPPVPILSQINPVHTPTSHFLRSILVSPSLLCLGLLSGLFPSYFPTKSLYASLLSPHTCYIPRPSLSSLFDRPINVGWRSLSSSLCNFLHSAVTPSLLGPNILLNTLFSNTLSLRSSLNVSFQACS